MKRFNTFITTFIFVAFSLNAQTYMFYVSENDDKQDYTVTVDLHSKEVYVEKGSLTVFKFRYYSLMVEDDKIGFSFSSGQQPQFKLSAALDNNERFLMIKNDAIGCYNPADDFVYSFIPNDFESYSSTFTKLKSLISGIANNESDEIIQLLALAEDGNAEVQNRLGTRFARGDGVEQNYNEAVKWFRKSAEQGYDCGEYNLGFSYYLGNGVSQDYSEAVKWFLKAANQGYPPAQYNLGICYVYGEGVTRSLTEAKKWFQKAADHGHENAKRALQDLSW